MNYQSYDIEDLACDPFFKKWILQNDESAEAFWTSWINTHPEKREIVLEARHLVVALVNEALPLSANKEKELQSRIHKSINTTTKNVNKKSGVLQNLNLRYAASISAILISFVTIFLLLAKNHQTLSGGQMSDIQISEVTVLQSLKGQKLPIKLPDGTVVKLNSDSKISYNNAFNSKDRMVELEGEAFFDVAKMEDKPFIVKTKNFTTHVLGTSFNVSSYPNETEHSVILVTGSVVINMKKEEESIALIKGDRLSYDNEQESHRKDKLQNFNDIQWKDGILVFDDQPIEKVFEKLERWYGVDIIVETPLRIQKRVTGKFDNESLSNVLQSICFYVNLNYSIKQNEVRIKQTSL